MSVRYSESDYQKLQKRLAGQQAIPKPLSQSNSKSGTISQCSVVDGKTTIGIKPMSINDVFKGRRFRTKEYDIYEERIIEVLPPFTLPSPPFKVTFSFGMSSKGSDVDNCIKPLQDVLSKHYGFNDNQIYELHVYKNIVPKGEEYFSFKIESV